MCAEAVGHISEAILQLSPASDLAALVHRSFICILFFDFLGLSAMKMHLIVIKMHLWTQWAAITNVTNNAWIEGFSNTSLDI